MKQKRIAVNDQTLVLLGYLAVFRVMTLDQMKILSNYSESYLVKRVNRLISQGYLDKYIDYKTKKCFII